MSVDIFSLLVGGTQYHGWTDASVSCSIETISGEFELVVADKWQGRNVRWPIRPGDACQLSAGGETLITGWVDVARPHVNAQECSLTVSGRDKTGDLVDCSAIQKPDQWTGRTLEELARILCVPFGISVKAEVSTGQPFPLFKLQPGEKAFDAIERLCRMRGILAMSDGAGNLLLTGPGKGGRYDFVLEEGKAGILDISGNFDHSDRFSEYVIKGQQSGLAAIQGLEVVSASKGGNVAGKVAAPSSGRARDAGVKRYRPLVMLSEGEATGPSPQVRAAWEASVRAARSTEVTIVYQGIRAAMPGSADGPIWRPNRLVRVVSETAGLDDVLLIKECRYAKNTTSGTTTEIGLTRPDAFTLLPEIPKGQGAAGLPPGTEVIR